MKIERYSLGYIKTNTYLIINEETKEAVLVDPASCPEYLVSHIKTKGYILKAILITHGHFDHVMGIDGWVKEFQVPVFLHEDEKEIIEDTSLNLSSVFGLQYSYHDAKCLRDGEKIELAGYEFRVIHTPGHTSGGCCYYCEAEGVLFSGDTLFCQSIGRTDFPTGSLSTLVRSIREKLFCLPDDVMVYPGHEDLTCIADEKLHNTFV